jgi:hypothetical protein
MHDYFLGRANCEQFLRYYFTIPVEANNPIISKGYEHLDPNHDLIFNNEDNKDRDGNIVPRKEYPIIPIFKEKSDDPYLPEKATKDNWPVIDEKEVNRFKKPMRKRFGKIIMLLAGLKGFGRILLWIGNTINMKDWKLFKSK